MITIDQLLESVDLNFEPRFVTKGNKGFIEIHKATPKRYDGYWSCQNDCLDCADFGRLKIAEFEGKDWTECIYEVPRKTPRKIKEIILTPATTKNTDMFIVNKINELVDAVNELKGANIENKE
jgi:hypothetical protein